MQIAGHYQPYTALQLMVVAMAMASGNNNPGALCLSQPGLAPCHVGQYSIACGAVQCVFIGSQTEIFLLETNQRLFRRLGVVRRCGCIVLKPLPVFRVLQSDVGRMLFILIKILLAEYDQLNLIPVFIWIRPGLVGEACA